MGSLLCFTVIAIQLTSSLANQYSIPLKCFLWNSNDLNLLGASPVPASRHAAPSIKTLKFEVLKANEVNFNKHGWSHDADTVKYEGLENSILDEFGFNMVTNVAQVTFHTDLLLTYPYKSNGTLFSKPIYGDGVARVFLKNVQYGLSIPFDIIEANSNKYIELRNFNSWYNVVDKADFDFGNLYNGNKELSDSMHKLINEKWKFITAQFGKVFMDKVTEYVFNVFKNNLLNTPLKDFSTC